MEIKLKKVSVGILLLFFSCILSGAGYRGTLPELSPINSPIPKPVDASVIDVLPLDKLTIPINPNDPVDKLGNAYKSEMIDVLRQLERMKEVLDSNKSYKNFVAAANVFDLTTQNILDKYPQERFKNTNKLLYNVNYDVQQIKDYWIKINKNAPYVSYYTTQGAYSGSVLREQLDKFSNVLGYAVRELRRSLNLYRE